MMDRERKTILKEVQDFAASAHSGQQRKYSSERYIDHPIRVMHLVEQYVSDEAVLAAALLHDVLEDTTVNEKQLQQFLTRVMGNEQANRALRLVSEMTDVYVKKDYPQWNRSKRHAMELGRIEKTSPESQTIRYADIIDNCYQIVEADPEFADTFLHECLTLLERTNLGHSELYEKSMKMVREGLQTLRQSQR